MANEVIATLTGSRLEVLDALGERIGKHRAAIQGLVEQQQSLADWWASELDGVEGPFGFEKLGQDVVLVRIVKDEIESAPEG